MNAPHAGEPNRGSEELWSLREDVFVEAVPENGSLIVYGRWEDVVIERPPEAVTAFIQRMQLGPVSLENVINPSGWRTTLPECDRVWLFVTLERLRHLIVRSLSAGRGEQPLLSVTPMTPQARFLVKPLDPERPVRLSVFASLSCTGSALRLESPLSLHYVVLHRPEAGWLAATLGQPHTPAQTAALVPLPRDVVLDALSYLAGAGMVVQDEGSAADGPAFAEDSDPVLRGWTRTDLTFHVSSTLGRHDRDFGATYPLGNEPRPSPVAERRAAGPGVVALHRPRLAELLEADPPFTAVLEGRASIHGFHAGPLPAEDLGELLYRSVRIRSLIGPPGTGPEQATTTDRPYPSGGGVHELEFYVAVDRCAGIARGVYAYDAAGHALIPIDAPPDHVSLLLRQACVAANLDGPPPVLIVLTARFRRLFWKFAGPGYALALKHVGVVQQTLHLVATAMGLVACAIGTGEIEDSSRILGLDWLAESSMGTFAVGRHADPAGPRARRAARHPVNDSDWARSRSDFGGSRSRPGS